MRIDVKKLCYVFCIVFYILIHFNCVYAEEIKGMNAKAYVLIDARSGRILCGHNEKEKMPMASTTKIMTCILAIENTDILKDNRCVAFSKRAAAMPDVQLDAVEGEKFYIKDLLYSLMLESHNDTAVAVAEGIGGSVEDFADMMNKKAEEIGAENTHFVTPNGLDSDEHYSTAYDMAIIARYAMKNEKFREIIKTGGYTFNSYKENESGEIYKRYSVNNKDSFLNMMEGACGIKTGYTSKAGYCFVGALERGNRRFISVVLGCGWPPEKNKKWSDTKKLMQYGIDNYKYNIIWDSNKFSKDIEVKDGEKKKCTLKAEGIGCYLMSPQDKYEIEYEIPEKIMAPVAENEIVGSVKVHINTEIIEQFDIRAANEIKLTKMAFFKKKISGFFACFF